MLFINESDLNFIDEYFLSLIKKNPTLREFENDLGLGLISKSLDFKIQSTLQHISEEVKELYYPQLETSFLAYLLYRVGYIRFKIPLSVYGEVVSTRNVTLPKYTRFSDGVDVYFLMQEVYLPIGVPTRMDLTLQNIYTYNEVIKGASLYYKIKTEIHYKDLVKVNLFLDDTQLEYSQNFVSMLSEYTYEISQEGTITVCVLLGNKKANNILDGDTLKVEILTTPDTQLTPETLRIIEEGYKDVSSCVNIALKENYKAPMDLEEMQNMLVYGRKNVGDICLNEDYLQFIYANFSEILELKVWQEKEEEDEVGTAISNINKVFVSYIKNDGTTGDRDLDSNIITYVQEKIYGKEVVIRDALKYPIQIIITITTNEIYDSTLIQVIQNKLTGFYDDIHKKINTDTVYADVYDILKGVFRQFSLNVSLSDKGIYENRKFFTVVPSDVTVGFTRY